MSPLPSVSLPSVAAPRVDANGTSFGKTKFTTNAYNRLVTQLLAPLDGVGCLVEEPFAPVGDGLGSGLQWPAVRRPAEEGREQVAVGGPARLQSDGPQLG